jgi:phage terminase large subunit-like protein
VNALQLAQLPPPVRAKIIGSLSNRERLSLQYAWESFWARPKQLPPPGQWLIWCLLAGRGFGKTRTGAQFIHRRAMQKKRHIVLAGATSGDIRHTMIEGDSGLLAVAAPHERPSYESSKARVTWPNGSWARLITADKPDKFRGPNCDTFWADELAAWRYAQDAWDQLMLTFRVGDDLRGVVSTTPRAIPLIKALIKRKSTAVVHGTSYENRANLSEAWFEEIISPYEGTRLGRQEILAHVLEDAPGALWKREQIDADRVRLQPKDMARVVISVDPAVTAKLGPKPTTGTVHKRRSNETAILAGCTAPAPPGFVHDAARKGKKKLHGYLLEDASGIYTMEKWAEKVIELYDAWEADHITCEVNQGGDLVAANIRTIRRDVKIVEVHATRGKYVRAEPIASLDEQHRIHHVGSFPMTEDQLCTWEPELGMESPDRLDAYVWLFTDLMIDRNTEPVGKGGGRSKGIPFEEQSMGYG